MISTENIHRITKYFLFSILILFHLCFAQDEIVQRLGDEDGFLQLSASRGPDNLEERSPNDYRTKISDYVPESHHFKIMFFVVLGLGLAMFVGLFFVCFKVTTRLDGVNTTSSIAGVIVHPPNTQATYNRNTGVEVSYINSAYTSGPQGSDRPPDYTTVTTTDTVNRNATFPQVVTKHIETPPPKYENAPVFK